MVNTQDAIPEVASAQLVVTSTSGSVKTAPFVGASIEAVGLTVSMDTETVPVAQLPAASQTSSDS